MNAKGCTTCANYSMVCRKCVESGNFSEYTEKSTEPVILDSGERREFESGAVRDMAEGKGRCDLMPLDLVAQIYEFDLEFYRARLRETAEIDEGEKYDRFLMSVHFFQEANKKVNLKAAIGYILAESAQSKPDIILALSRHFEKGAKKYGERNWEKGLPESCYIDSAVRHYLKWRAGHTDEPHYIACLWNLVCLWWTHENITETEE